LPAGAPSRFARPAGLANGVWDGFRCEGSFQSESVPTPGRGRGVAHPSRSEGWGRDSPGQVHQKPPNPARIPQLPLPFPFTALRHLRTAYNS